MMMQSTTAVPVSNTGGGGLTIADKLDTGSPVDHVPSSGTIDEKKDSTSATDEIDHSSEYNPQHQQQQYHNPYATNQYTTAAPHIIAGMVVPPQQVYVQQQQQQVPLEAQFQSLGLGTNEGNDDEHQQNSTITDGQIDVGINEKGENIVNSGDEQQEGDIDETENGEGEEEPIKLFVGQVRKQKRKRKK